MGYLDFDIEIGPGTGRTYPVVVHSAAGNTRATMQFPYDDLTLKDKLKDLRIALLQSSQPHRALTEEERAVQEFGQQLFEVLFAGIVGSLFYESRTKADHEGLLGVRLRLNVLAPDLAGLPWEYLYDPREGDYLCLSRKTPMVRYPELAAPLQPLLVTPPLRILGMIASPKDQPPLDIANEKRRMEEALKELKASGQVELVWLAGQTWEDLQEAMWGGPWHIFHFIGHGAFNKNQNEGYIGLDDGKGGTHLLSARDLAQMLTNHSTLRLVILNACEGAKGGAQDIFSSTAGTLARRGIPAVLAMQENITDKAAIQLTRTFYRALANGLPVDAAVAEVRTAIRTNLRHSLEWGTPVLFLRAPDSTLFTLSHTPQPPVRSRLAPPLIRQLRALPWRTALILAIPVVFLLSLLLAGIHFFAWWAALVALFGTVALGLVLHWRTGARRSIEGLQQATRQRSVLLTGAGLVLVTIILLRLLFPLGSHGALLGAVGAEQQTPAPTSTPGASPATTPSATQTFQSTATPISTAPATNMISQFPLPPNSSPGGITVGPDRNLWFTDTNAIGRMTPTGQVTEFQLPNLNSFPRQITAGPDRNLWFTEGEGNRIGRITLQGQISVFPVPTPNSSPEGITAGPDGNLWFTEFNSNKIGRITLQGQISEFPTPTANSAPADITTGPDGNLWFIEITGNQIGRITLQGQFSEFTANGLAGGITKGPDGNLWFTEAEGNGKIGRITLQGQFSEFPLPNYNSEPDEITSGPDRNLWFTENTGNRIGRITPGGQLTEFPIPTVNSSPGGITVGPDGNLWFTESCNTLADTCTPSQIGRITSGK